MFERLINELSQSTVDKIIEDSTEYSATNGIVMLDPIYLPLKRYRSLPTTLFPSPIPRLEYEKVMRIQPYINKLYHLMSEDQDFMNSVLHEVAEVDDFTRNFFEIYKKHLEYCDRNEVLTLAILRADYMFGLMKDENGKTIEKSLQTEVNTVSSGMGSIGSKAINNMFSTVLKEKPLSDLVDQVPENCANPLLGQGFVFAWEAYGNESAIIVFFVLENETNISDHRTLEYNIYNINPKIIVRRKVYNQIIEDVYTDENGRLFIDDEEVAIAYFRTCYSPKHFPTRQHWKAREIIELSKAIKSPSVAHHLVGCKKIQEVLTRRGVVENYLTNCTAVSEVRSTFTNMYPLEMNKDGDKAMKMAIERPEEYVLKPQREGGGNNFYDDELKHKLLEIKNNEERKGFVLMDKIKAKSYPNYINLGGETKKDDVISELGIFGVFLSKGNRLLKNYTAGFLHRVKSVEFNEGGIMSGTGAVSSPFLS